MNYEENEKRSGKAADRDIPRLLVSVCCLSYNHGAYLREALDSFLMQEGDFELEILIHDDASTDDSADIIREYEARCPGIVKPICQSENQYSRGISNPSGVFNFPRARGAYIAMCEGDDYWTDPEKIAKELAVMEAHPEYTFCSHAASIVYTGDAHKMSSSVRPYDGTRELAPADVISKKTNIPMASLFFRTKYAFDLPDWYYSCPVGDIPLQLWLTEHGPGYYIDEELSAYREESAGSWGESMLGDGTSEAHRRWETHFEAMERLYASFDEETGGSYHDAVTEALGRLRFQIDLKEGRAAAVLDPANRLFVSELPKREVILQRIRARAPFAYELLRKAYRVKNILHYR